MERLKGSLTKDIYNGKIKKGFSIELTRVCLKKLLFVLSRCCLEDFRVPSTNNFEKLEGHKEEKYLMTIDVQYGIFLEWKGDKAINIEIIDYNKYKEFV